jgi:hypothetical protein
MEFEEEVFNKKIELKNEINITANGLLDKYPIVLYLNEITSYPESFYYNYISTKLENTFDNIKSDYSESVLSSYHKLALAALIELSIKKLKEIEISYDIKKLYRKWYLRVIKDFSIQPNDFYNHHGDLFLKDLGICALRIIPVGAQIVTTSFIPRGYFVNVNPLMVLRGLLFTVLKMKGFGPFYEIHTDNRYLGEFNYDGWNKCYLRIASLLKQNTRIKGMVGGSWFFDPVLERISPRLTYLRKVPTENGAKIFRIGSNQDIINDALFASATRRKLYIEKKYAPTPYLLIWCKNDLIRWAEKFKMNGYHD